MSILISKMSLEKEPKMSKEKRSNENIFGQAKEITGNYGVRAKKGAISFFEDFKTFIARGNVIDLAIALVVGGAFSLIVKSFVDDLITPIIGLGLAQVNLENLFHVLRNGKTPCTSTPCYPTMELAAKDGAVTLNYGKFIQTIINFLISGFFMFVVVKLIQNMRRKEEPTSNERLCPYCVSKINVGATRCPFCTSAILAIDPINP
jgi:large conductance mechanosensitive channel